MCVPKRRAKGHFFSKYYILHSIKRFEVLERNLAVGNICAEFEDNRPTIVTLDHGYIHVGYFYKARKSYSLTGSHNIII